MPEMTYKGQIHGNDRRNQRIQRRAQAAQRMAKNELMMTSPDVPKEDKEFAPFIRSFDSFKNEEIRSNFGGLVAQDDKGQDDVDKSPSPLNSSGTFSMNNSSSSNKSTDSDSSDKDM